MVKAELEVKFFSLDSVLTNFVYGILVGNSRTWMPGVVQSDFTFLTSQAQWIRHYFHNTYILMRIKQSMYSCSDMYK